MATEYPEIAKDISALKLPPNLADYDSLRSSWDWDELWAELDTPDGLVNQAHECIDRHAMGERANKLALIWQSQGLEVEEYTFADLKRETDRAANALRSAGIEKGDRVFFLSDRTPELYFGFFGALKLGALAAPLFSAFGPEPISERVGRAEGKAMITTPKLLSKVNEIRDNLPSLEHVIIMDGREEHELADTDISWSALIADASDEFEIEKTGPEDWSVMHFTSGTTGLPKGAAHVHNTVVSHYATGKYVMDFQEEDIYWCTADPGWVTGTSYGMFAPWSNGITQVIDEGGFGARRWYETITRFKVTIWYTAPTAIRLLMRSGASAAREHDLSSLRYVMSVGEPLNPEGVVWGLDAFDLPIHDNWWQTETGAIMMRQLRVDAEVRPGSMGKPIPGHRRWASWTTRVQPDDRAG